MAQKADALLLNPDSCISLTALSSSHRRFSQTRAEWPKLRLTRNEDSFGGGNRTGMRF